MAYSSSSWSNLPLDLLIDIKNKLQPSKHNELEVSQPIDQIFFRSVCSQWHSAVPAPNSSSRYLASYDERCDNTIHFTNLSTSHSFSLLFATSSPLYYLCSCNGWLAFKSWHMKALYLFNPISNLKLTFPNISPRIFHNKLESFHEKIRVYISKVVVSSSAATGVAVLAYLNMYYKNKFRSERWIAYCKHGDGQRWRLLMKGVADIAVAGDGRFYAIAENWELCVVVDERPPWIGLKRFKIWVPRQILKADPGKNQRNEHKSITCWNMEACGGSNLRIYGSRDEMDSCADWICLELDVTKICRSSNNVDIACEAQWLFLYEHVYDNNDYFIPSMRDLWLKKLINA